MNTLYVTIAGLFLIGIWAVQSTVWIIKVKSNGRKSVNNLLYDSIPGVFTSLGVLGTFSGILFGLLGFDASDLDIYIPILLGGMKTAFITSVVGLLCSLVFSRISKMVWYSADDDDAVDMSSEVGVLRSILSTLQSDAAQNEANNQALINEMKSLTQSIIGAGEESLNSQLLKLRTTFRDSQDDIIKELLELSRVTRKI